MSNSSNNEFNPIAGIAALVIPGAGHFVLGQTKRGIFAMIGVLGLFFFGLFLGGIDAIDSKNDKFWFYGQSLVGAPTLAVNYVHQNHFKAQDPRTQQLRSGLPNERRVDSGTGVFVWQPMTDLEIEQGMKQPNTPGLGRINEIAMLSVVLAGMLNLIIFLDALMPTPNRLPNKNSSNTPRKTPTPEVSAETSGGASS